MKINFNQEFKTIEGDTLLRNKLNRESSKEIALPATLKWAAVEVLLVPPATVQLSGEEKAKRYELALLIQNACSSIDVPVEDAALIKKLCDAHFPPIIVGQTRRMLDCESGA